MIKVKDFNCLIMILCRTTVFAIYIYLKYIFICFAFILESVIDSA